MDLWQAILAGGAGTGVGVAAGYAIAQRARKAASLLAFPELCMQLSRDLKINFEEQDLSQIRVVAFDAFGTLTRIVDNRNPWKQIARLSTLRVDARVLPGSIRDYAEACKVDWDPRWQDDLDVELASIEVYDDVRETITVLARAGYRLALVSNVASPYIRPLQKLLGPVFEREIYSCDVGSAKPRPGIFGHLCVEFDIEPEAILVVGNDWRSDGFGPRRFGMKSLTVNRGQPMDNGFVSSLNDVADLLREARRGEVIKAEQRRVDVVPQRRVRTMADTAPSRPRRLVHIRLADPARADVGRIAGVLSNHGLTVRAARDLARQLRDDGQLPAITPHVADWLAFHKAMEVAGTAVVAMPEHSTATALAEFVAHHLPKIKVPVGWEHSFCSAWQMSCELLEALGHANETDWGAVPVAEPKVSDILPRWDDACVALMSLALQNGLVEFHGPESDAAPLILPAHGLHGASPTQELEVLMGRLGLIEGGSWTVDAVPVIWRDWPYDWPALDLKVYPDFVAVAQRAVDAIPAEAEEQIARGMAHSDPHIQTLLVEHALHRQWRYPDGWLALAEGEPRALDIFHDPCATFAAKVIIGARSGDLA